MTSIQQYLQGQISEIKPCKTNIIYPIHSPPQQKRIKIIRATFKTNKQDVSSTSVSPHSSNCSTIIKSKIAKQPRKIKILKRYSTYYDSSSIKTEERNSLSWESHKTSNLINTPKRALLFDEEDEDNLNLAKLQLHQQLQQQYQQPSPTLSKDSFQWLSKKHEHIKILKPTFQLNQTRKKSIIVKQKTEDTYNKGHCEQIILTGSSGVIKGKKFQFNCFRDRDLQMSKQLMNKQKELTVDDDVMTDEETVDNYVRVCFKDIISGIRLQEFLKQNYQVSLNIDEKTDPKDLLWRYFNPTLFATKKLKATKS